MTQETNTPAERPGLPLNGFEPAIARASSAAALPTASWSVDVSPSVGVEPPTVTVPGSRSPLENKPAKNGTPVRSKRGLSRLTPKTDSQAIKRRERLRKLREKTRTLPSVESAAASPHATEVPTVDRNVSTNQQPETESSAFVEPSKAIAHPITSQIVRSQVVAEIASLVSENLNPPAAQERAPEQIEMAVAEEIPTAPTEDKLVIKPVARRFAVTEPKPVEEERYFDWLRRVVLKNKWVSVFTTCYVHWLILLALAAILVNGPENAANLLINASFADEETLQEESFEMTVPDPEPSEQLEDVTPEPAAIELAQLEESKLTLSESVLDTIAPQAAEAKANTSVPTPSESRPPAGVPRPPNPAPVRAISKGSFSVWTEPTNPQAGEPYRIVIQVCLPNSLERYNVADLQGVVVGSDGYRKPIPGYLRGFLPVENGYARLIIPIVSADAKVKDTVFIRSRVLKETQKLLIEFESEL